MSNLKEKFLKGKSKVITSAAFIATSAALTVFAFAEETVGTVDITGPLQSGLNSAVVNTIACFSAIIPIALTIFGAKFAWIKGVQFFSSIAKK